MGRKNKIAHLLRGQQHEVEGVAVDAVEVQRQRLRERRPPRPRRSPPPPPPRHEERKELCLTTTKMTRKMMMLSCSMTKTRRTTRRLCSFPTNERMLLQARVREGGKLRRDQSGRRLLVVLPRGRQNNR